MPEQENEMSQEEKIVGLSKDMKHLTESFKDLKGALEKRDVQIHDHINRKFEGDLNLSQLTQKAETMKYVDNEVNKSALKLISVFTALIAVVGGSILTWVYMQNNLRNITPPPTENRITVEQANSMVETITREMKSANKAYLKEARIKGSKSEFEILE